MKTWIAIGIVLLLVAGLAGFILAGGFETKGEVPAENNVKPEQPEQPKDPEDPERDKGIFIEKPRNPRTPGEVVAAWAFLCAEGKYDEAEKLMTEEGIRQLGGAEFAWSFISKGVPLVEVYIADVCIDDTGKRARVEAVFRFAVGDSFRSNPSLIKEDGKWKLNL